MVGKAEKQQLFNTFPSGSNVHSIFNEVFGFGDVNFEIFKKSNCPFTKKPIRNIFIYVFSSLTRSGVI